MVINPTRHTVRPGKKSRCLPNGCVKLLGSRVKYKAKLTLFQYILNFLGRIFGNFLKILALQQCFFLCLNLLDFYVSFFEKMLFGSNLGCIQKLSFYRSRQKIQNTKKDVSSQAQPSTQHSKDYTRAFTFSSTFFNNPLKSYVY